MNPYQRVRPNTARAMFTAKTCETSSYESGLPNCYIYEQKAVEGNGPHFIANAASLSCGSFPAQSFFAAFSAGRKKKDVCLTSLNTSSCLTFFGK